MPQQTPNEEGRHDAYVSPGNIMVVLMAQFLSFAIFPPLYILVKKIDTYRDTW